MRPASWKILSLKIYSAVHGTYRAAQKAAGATTKNGQTQRPKCNGIDCDTQLEWSCLSGTRPNGSLGIFDKNNAEHSTVGAALRSNPHQKGRYLSFHLLGRPTAALFIGNCLPQSL